jgi:hypothetical protein
LFATAAFAALPDYALELLPPHVLHRSSAVLNEPLRRTIDASLAGASVSTLESARDFSLATTDALLHFGLDHTTSFAFAASEREGNCIEYSHLFARVFERVAGKIGLDARAYVVHSSTAHLFGRQLPFRGFADHDWVLVVDGTGEDARRFYIDPTLHDVGLGWDISSNVRGTVNVPK